MRTRRGVVNLAYTVGVAFVGDPAGAALTSGIQRVYGQGLNGGTGTIYVGDVGSAERSWNGALPTTPQKGLMPKNSGLATPMSSVYRNGPTDLTNSISAQAGGIAIDARMRALANRVGR